MIAKVRRRATSAASGECEGFSVETARSDISEPVAGKPGRIKEDYSVFKRFIYGLRGRTPIAAG
jgi:hypothetical protein